MRKLKQKLLFKASILGFKLERKILNKYWFDVPASEELAKQYIINDHLFRQRFISRHTKRDFKGLHPKNVFNYRNEFFIKETNSQDVVIDLGCGTGLILKKISKKIKKGIGIDYDQRNIKICHEQHSEQNLTFIKGDILNLDYKKLKQRYNYNTLVVSHVLEHLDDPISLMKNSLAHKLLICVPSEENWLTQLKKHYGLPYLSDSTHRKEYTREILENECLQAGYVVEYISFNSEGEIICKACKLSKSKSQNPVLSYASVQPKKENLANGGRVKLTYLFDFFTHNDHQFNILYLVSSKLPKQLKKIIDRCKKEEIKIVLNQNGVAYPAWAGEEFEQVNKPLKLALENADYIFYQSNFSKESANRFLGKPTCNSQVLHNAVDLKLFKDLGKRSDGVVKLLAMGSHHESERIFLAIDVLEELCRGKGEYQLILAGKYLWSKQAQREMEVYIAEKGLVPFVIIHGEYSQHQAVGLYNQSHILLHLKYNDPCPTVPLEAMACGVPVIASASGGMPELLGDTGKLLEIISNWEEMFYPNKNKIVKAVNSLVTDWKENSEKAKQRVHEKFSMSSWLKIHEKTFKKLLV